MDERQHEDNLMDQRIRWFLTIQGFLFAAFGIVMRTPGIEQMKQMKQMKVLLATLGIVTSLSTGILLWHGAKKLDKQNQPNPKKLDEKNQTNPKKLDEENQPNPWWRFFFPWYVFPIVFMAAWVYVAC